MAVFDDSLNQSELDAALAGKADASHTHTIANVTGLQGALDGKAPATHGHGIIDVTGLQAALDGKAASAHSHGLNDLANVDAAAPTDGQALKFDAASGNWIPATLSGGGGVTDHGALTGLGDDDHPQYHTDARGDLRYYTKGQVDAALGGKAATTHNHDAAYAPTTHNHDTAYAASSHNHDTAYAPISHTHEIADVNGLASALAGAGSVDRVIISANHTAVADQEVSVNTALAAVTITAPASGYFFVGDGGSNASVNNITIDFGATGFGGVANSDFTIDVDNFGTGFLLVGGVWRTWK